MDWVLIITLALTGTLDGGKYATIETVEFSSSESCEAAKSVYLAENKNRDGVIFSAVCVSRATVITR